jgi:hypothetical protein
MKYHYITYVLAFLIALTGVSALSMVGGTTYSIGNYTYHVFTSNNTLNVTGSGTVAIMVLAGGGGGGGGISGGGGAGGFYNNPTMSISTGSYNVIVGAGGAGGTTNNWGTNGQNSSFNGTIIMNGGGGGGTYNGGSAGKHYGLSGGSGGGAGADDTTAFSGGNATPSGQGNKGGAGNGGTGQWSAGGGGGSNTTGVNASVTTAGSGGAGNYTNINGSDVCYAGGGGGGHYDGGSLARAGNATCGGGNGAIGNPGTGGANATANKGGGGGGAGNGASGGNGGSGIVVVKYYSVASPIAFNTTSPAASISIAEPNNQTFSYTINNTDSIQTTSTWLINGTNSTVCYNQSSCTFTGNYTSSGTYVYNVSIVSSSNNISYQWTLTVNETPEFNYYLAKNDLTNASINTFNVTLTYNNIDYFYSTSNGTALIHRELIPNNATINITARSYGYIDKTYINIHNTNSTTLNLSQIMYFSFTNHDIDTDAVISVFTAVVNGTTIPTNTGSIVTSIISNYGYLVDIIIESEHYVPNVITGYNTSNTPAQFNSTSFNATREHNISDPYVMAIGRPYTISLDTYYDNVEEYDIEVIYLVNGSNGTGVVIGQSTGVFSVETVYYNVTLDGHNLDLLAINAPYNWSIRIITNDENGDVLYEQRFAVNSVTVTNAGLGFTFDVADAKFWLFIIVGIGLLVLTLLYPGNFIGYVAGMFYLYYFIEFMLEGTIPMIYIVVMLLMSILCVFVEISNNK